MATKNLDKLQKIISAFDEESLSKKGSTCSGFGSYYLNYQTTTNKC